MRAMFRLLVYGAIIAAAFFVANSKQKAELQQPPIPSGAEQIEAGGYLNLGYSDKSWTNWYSARFAFVERH
jgi:hypothetical protein